MKAWIKNANWLGIRDRQSLAVNSSSRQAKHRLRRISYTTQLSRCVRHFRSTYSPQPNQAGDLEQGCRGAIPQQIESITSTCERLFEADALYRQKFESVERGLSQLEETYVTQRKAQEALLRVAEQYQ